MFFVERLIISVPISEGPLSEVPLHVAIIYCIYHQYNQVSRVDSSMHSCAYFKARCKT